MPHTYDSMNTYNSNLTTLRHKALHRWLHLTDFAADISAVTLCFLSTIANCFLKCATRTQP